MFLGLFSFAEVSSCCLAVCVCVNNFYSLVNCAIVAKQEVAEFKACHPHIGHSCDAVYIKVYNERETAKRRAAKRLADFEQSD